MGVHHRSSWRCVAMGAAPQSRSINAVANKIRMTMKLKDSRSDSQTTENVQHGNRSWWSENPMTYDWHGNITLPRGTRDWFDEIDRRFIDSSRPYLTSQRPFDRIMPDDLQGRQVLEIGCGMG